MLVSYNESRIKLHLPDRKRHGTQVARESAKSVPDPSQVFNFPSKLLILMSVQIHFHLNELNQRPIGYSLHRSSKSTSQAVSNVLPSRQGLKQLKSSPGFACLETVTRTTKGTRQTNELPGDTLRSRLEQYGPAERSHKDSQPPAYLSRQVRATLHRLFLGQRSSHLLHLEKILHEKN